MILVTRKLGRIENKKDANFGDPMRPKDANLKIPWRTMLMVYSKLQLDKLFDTIACIVIINTISRVHMSISKF